ncbi:phosphoinositide-specific phospholipase C [Cavenderia fasciculata]|uniref:Phosphoinositide phospholipase C n=1 Tax=Cavenderia fasciculata TaxID=261658 RepID=F4PW60_CACFS|nr:phosphoinositide-specific phospholipase C [Cavenderia fasciculata]EGG20224.1 phosphoinositide-specific phospholipase C [Cavenderia fasciculata]|eukprot:XP_004367207.1 phosphoinositide-specific phospholipase C [Cavenderia fasciculata]
MSTENINSLSEFMKELSTDDYLGFSNVSSKKELIIDIQGLDEDSNSYANHHGNFEKFISGYMIDRVTTKGNIMSKKWYLTFVKVIWFVIKRKTKKRYTESPVDYRVSFSLMYSNNLKSLDFVCTSIEARQELVSALYLVIKQSRSSDNELGFIRKQWNYFGKDTLGASDLRKLLSRLNYSTSHGKATDLIESVDKNGDKVLDFIEFSELFNLLRRRPEIKLILTKYAKTLDNQLSISEMIDFFKYEQSEEWSTKDCQHLIENFSHDPSAKTITIDQLEDYLTSSNNDVFEPKARKTYMDTNQPISNYYMNSSHNTYLAGHQLQGISSSEMYVLAMKKNCKCVECIIKDYGFENSPYPVILILETHCTPPQQVKMIEHMVVIFGDMLAKPFTEEDVDKVKILPTLEQLKYKVILKGSYNCRIVTDKKQISEMLEEEEESSLTDSSSSNKKSSKTPKPPKVTVAPEYAKWIYLLSKGFSSVDDSNKLPVWVMHSFSEDKIMEFIKSDYTASVVELATRKELRVYPRGTRFGSSNFDPVPGWTVGAQIVALNQQTSSEPMWLNAGMFADNGASGYVLKPPCLLPSTVPGEFNYFDPSQLTRHASSKYSKLIVNIISARQLPKYTKTEGGEVIDPFITISMHGAEFDKQEFKTKVIDNNGFNPHWGEEFEFPLIHDQVAMLLIRVDDKDKFKRQNRIGHYCIKVSNIRNGYRIIKLENDYGNQIPMCNLLCKFTLVPNSNRAE